MGEKLWEKMQKTADVLHWLGKYQERDAIILASRLMRAKGIEEMDEWENFVTSQEKLFVAQGKGHDGA